VGRIKELRDLKAKNEATAEEIAELEELETEATEKPRPETTTAEATPEEEVDKLAEAIVSKINIATEKFEAAVAKSEKAVTPQATVTEGQYIVDKHLGKVTIDKLSEMKVELPGRKAAGKSITEVTGKTVAFVQALMQGDKQKLQLLTEGTGTAGGYTVPEEFANMIVEDKRDIVVMRQLADSITISSDTLHLPTLEGRPKANWRSEAAVKATSTAQFNELVFTPYSLAVIVGLSQELADDASLGVGGSIVNYVAKLMVRSLAEKEENAFWMGNGSGKPTGINNYTIPGVDAGGTDSSLADAIKTLYWRLPQGHRNNAAWVGHQQAWERVNKAKDTQNNYLLTRLADGPTPTLQGRPVYEQNDLPVDVIYFGDFSYYMIVDRQGIQVDFSTEATVGGSSAFEKNLVFVRVEQRVDAELTLTNAVRKLSGLN
jgi:HK97 family phage major capsid protein